MEDGGDIEQRIETDLSSTEAAEPEPETDESTNPDEQDENVNNGLGETPDVTEAVDAGNISMESTEEIQHEVVTPTETPVVEETENFQETPEDNLFENVQDTLEKNPLQENFEEIQAENVENTLEEIQSSVLDNQPTMQDHDEWVMEQQQHHDYQPQVQEQQTHDGQAHEQIAEHEYKLQPQQNDDQQLHEPQSQEENVGQEDPQDYGLGHNLTQEAGLLPDWLLLIIHDSSVIDGDRLALLAIISITLLALHLINSFINKSSREQPLIKRLADLDRKLFSATNELLIMKKEQAESKDTSVMDSGDGMEGQAMREVELQLQQTWAELETSRETLRQESERTTRIVSELESSRREAVLAMDEAKAAQEMVEELIANQGTKTGARADDQLISVVTELQSQLESQKVVLGKYEPRLKRKEKENKELTKQIKQLRADVANANLEKEKMKKELTETMRSVEESASKLNEVFKNEEEWKSLSDLLQAQLDEKSMAINEMETEMSSLKSRISVFKNEADSKEEQLEVLQETLDELQNRGNKGMSKNGDNGWDVEDEENGWDVEDINDIRETAQLRVENKKNKEMKETLENELSELKSKLANSESDLEKFKIEAISLREARDEVTKDLTDLQRRMEVLTEFFNKKEAELQRQLGLQSAKFGDVSTDAESSARQLVSVSSELDATRDQVRIIKTELEDQERSLKAAVATQEKKAHENWVAARQAERKLTEFQVVT